MGGELCAEREEREEHRAGNRPRWDYRRLGVLLAREGHVLKHKLVYRPYRDEDLAVRHRRRKRAAGARVPLDGSPRPNERWAMNFVSDAWANERKLRCLTILRLHKTLGNKTPAEFAREHVVSVASPHTPRLPLRVTQCREAGHL